MLIVEWPKIGHQSFNCNTIFRSESSKIAWILLQYLLDINHKYWGILHNVGNNKATHSKLAARWGYAPHFLFNWVFCQLSIWDWAVILDKAGELDTKSLDEKGWDWLNCLISSLHKQNISSPIWTLGRAWGGGFRKCTHNYKVPIEEI